MYNIDYAHMVVKSVRITYRTKSGYFFSGVVTADVAIQLCANLAGQVIRPLNYLLKQANSAAKLPAFLPVWANSHEKAVMVLANFGEPVEFIGISDLETDQIIL